ncbi:uncharacterized protein IL334_007659 [Kwoniella shivajii]|uniref:Nucleoporin nsp1 n=1 Tax=Kwoniella shivajii TaxID=564305 RepID=A0ABZ1D995_9TREE|nr:hypothetical protein IL334_007659 [Kwoniella shivajii]
MSGRDQNRSSLSGAARQSGNPRTHSLAKPYSRPTSFNGIGSTNGLSSSATLTDLANVSTSLISPTKNRPNSPTKINTNNSSSNSNSNSNSHTTRLINSSSSYGSLPRSNSDNSLFTVSSIKSIFSRPLQWLATPAKSGLTSSNSMNFGSTPSGNGNANRGKRDSFSSFGNDLENPDSNNEAEELSPSDHRKRIQKRFRRNSPSPEKQSSSRHQNQRKQNGHYNSTNQSERGDYEPQSTPKFEIQGRAISGFMLPPLSPNITLKPKSHLPQHINHEKEQSSTNFSRPLGSIGGLSTSKSMSYLDPPSDVLNPSSPRKGGMLTRSKRVELSSLVDEDVDDDHRMDDHHSSKGNEKGKGKDIEGNTWSPWKSRYSTSGGAASSSANPRPTTPSKRTPSRLMEQRDYTLPSLSPFRAPPSPLNRHSPLVPNAGASSSGLTRSATTANIRKAASVASDVSMGRSGSVRGIRQSGSMLFGSVNGDREKDDDRMSVDGEQRQREGSVLDWFMKDRWDGRPGSPASAAASRRLGSAGPSLSHAPIRKGQLVWHEEDKAFVRESELRAAQAPPAIHKNEAERILYTLESMRKTPLTDARKGDLPPLVGQSSRTMRKTINVPLATAAAGVSAKSRRDKDKLGGDDRVSVMISPYGRRKVADQEARDERRSKAVDERGYRPSPTPTASDAQSDRSQASDIEMDLPSSQKSHSPAPAPTPRRSSRLKRPTTADEDESTPKPSRRTTKRGTSKQPETVQEDQSQPTPRGRRTRKATVERATSPTPPTANSVPTITATAPSPGGPTGSTAQTVSTSSYQPLADGERSRGGSSLRARSDVTKRTHVGAANYSRSATPSSGRFSAKEEDLPDMDELEQAKIPLPSFSGISFAGLSAIPPTTTNASTEEGSSTLVSAGSTAESPAAQPSSSLGVPPPGRRPGGPLARVGMSSTRPRASSPLAAGSIVAQPESPPSAPGPSKSTQPPSNGFFGLTGSASASIPPTGSTTPLGKPPASSFFSGPTSTNGEKEKEKSFSFGLGKPPSANPTAEADNKSSGIPDFFGKKSAPPSGTTTPSSVPSFDFGLSKKPTTEDSKAPPAQLPPSTFSFGNSAAASQPSTNGSSSSAAGFNFGATKDNGAKETNAPAFSFGNSKPAQTAAPAFSFGTSSAKPADPPKSTFNFGNPASTGSAAERPSEAAKPAFSFGSSSADTAKPAEAAKPAFSFGTSSAATTTPKVAETAKPAFSFGVGSTTPASAPPASNASAPAPAPAFGGFNFDKPAEKKDAQPSNPFGSTASATGGSGSAAPSFTFGASTTPNTSSPFGASASQTNGDAGKSNPFGSSSNPPKAPTSTGFNFGGTNTKQANGSSPAFGSAPAPAAASNPFAFGSSPAATSPALAPTSNPFGAAPGSPATTPAPSFAFGQSSSTATPAAAPSTGFGSTPYSNPFSVPAQPAAAATSGGFNFAFNGGSNAPQASSPAPTSGGFNFGQSTPSTPAAATANNGSFNFGATPSTQPAFGGFGQSGATTTPAAPPPSSGFAFGASPAQAQPQRFGSPAPADGGFSLGATDPVAPGSPGGRKVKGLPRRGAIKR